MKRLQSLDALRGIPALSVVVWHWQHFYDLGGSTQPGWRHDSQPFFWILKLLYEGGWAAVDLFFALSGFVFFWHYSAAIANRGISGPRFFLLRFSRLYPLHFATLVFVAALEFVYRRQAGAYFVYGSGGWYHFVESLLMAQQWLPPSMTAIFNGPAWSVSIEVLLYIIFFWGCRAGLRGPRICLAIAVLSVAVHPYNEFISRGLMGFFLGGAVWHGTEWVKARRDAARIARLLGWGAVLAWLVVVAEDYTGILHDAAGWLAIHISDGAARYYADQSANLFLLPFIFIVSPLTVSALALHEQVLGARYTRLAVLGDISYSTYLLHFPLQMTLAMAALHLGWTPQTFMQPWVMLAFFAVLGGLGLASFHGFERPLQAFIRNTARARSRAPAPETA